MSILLVRPSEKYKDQIKLMMDEWLNSGEQIIPQSISHYRFDDFNNFISSFQFEIDGPLKEGFVRATTYFAYEDSTDTMIGAVNIRHSLNSYLLRNGGHIGGGVRPSERKKGYATEISKLSLIKCKELGINRVMMSCRKDNIGSANTIIKIGGILEREFVNDIGVTEQIFWIELNNN